MENNMNKKVCNEMDIDWSIGIKVTKREGEPFWEFP